MGHERSTGHGRLTSPGHGLLLAVVALLLMSCVRGATPVDANTIAVRSPGPVAPVPNAAQLFREHCATCHLGGGGLLGSPRTPDLFEDALPRGQSEEAILHAMKFGIDPPRMPAFGAGLTIEEMKSLSTHILERRSAYSGDQRKRIPNPKR